MKSLIENIGLALHKVQPVKGEWGFKGQHTAAKSQWREDVHAIAAVIIRPAGLCNHDKCIAQRHVDFVTLCETGKFPLKKKEDTPKHSEGDSLDVRIIKMSAAEALTLLGGMSLQQLLSRSPDGETVDLGQQSHALRELLFGEDSDFTPDSIRH